MDYADLTGDRTVLQSLPELTSELKEQPELILNCLGVAIHQVHVVQRILNPYNCKLQQDF